MRRTKEQAAVTRQTILRAAEQLFLERGYDQVSLDQIAEAAGATRGAVHFHFVNKPGVMLSVCEEDHARLLALVEGLERLDPEPSVPLDELREMLVGTLKTYQGNDRRRALIRAFMVMGLKLTDDERGAVHIDFQRNQAVILAVLEEAPARFLPHDPGPAFLLFQQRLLTVRAAIFEAAAARGQLAAPWTARTAAAALFSMMNGLMVGWAMGNDVQLAPAGVESVRGLMAAFRR